jgi:hypothetical protein
VKSSSGYHVIRVQTHRDETFLPLAAGEGPHPSAADAAARALAGGGPVPGDRSGAAQGPFARGSCEGTGPRRAVEPGAGARRDEATARLGGTRRASLRAEARRSRAAGVPIAERRLRVHCARRRPAPRLPEQKEVQDQLRQELLQEKALERARVLAAD